MIDCVVSRWHKQCGYKEILILAWPLILCNCSLTIQQFVNRVFLSWYSSESLAASAPAGAFSFLAVCLFIGIAGYSSTFIAQYHGSGRNDRIASCFWQAFYLSIFFSLLVLCILPFSRRLFQLTGHPQALINQELTYFNIMIAGGFFAIGGAALSGLFMGLGRTRVLLWSSGIATATNMILDYLMIFGKCGFPEMGIRGAAIASVIGTAVGFVTLAVILLRGNIRSEYQLFEGAKLDLRLTRRIVRFGLPSGMQLLLDVLVWSIFLLFVGRISVVALAATNLAFQINCISFMPTLGIGSAVGIIVARELGKNSPSNAATSVWSAIHMGISFNLLMAFVYIFAPILLVYPFTAKADPAQGTALFSTSVILLRYLSIYTIADAVSIIFSSALRGAGDTLYVMCVLIVIGISFMVVPTYYAVQPGGGGLIKAWLYVTIYVFILFTAFFLRFRQGKWKEMRVIEPQVAIID